MSTIQVKVPISGNQSEREGWLYNVSQHIDAGNDVEFVDALDGSNVNITTIQLDTAGSVAIWGKGYQQMDAQRIALTAGVFHTIPGIHGLDVANTDASKGIHVKI